MPVTYLQSREVELAVQVEAAYGTSPGAVAGTDMFKHTSRLHITPQRGTYLRDQDTAYQNASILGAQTGREWSEIAIACDVIPSGNVAVITEPDVDPLIHNCMGSKHKATAHTTTGAGSAGVSLVLVAGGAAASGIAIKDLIAVHLSTILGYEVRRVTNVVGDTVTVNAAFTADPAAGRTVKLGVTYRLTSVEAARLAPSLYLLQWIAGDAQRSAVPGVVIQSLDLSAEFAGEVPKTAISFAGKGKKEITHAQARPSPATAGQPLLPTNGKVWIGSSLLYIISAALKVGGLTDLDMVESGAMEPTRVKLTGNSAHWNIEQTLKLLLSLGDRDTVAWYEAAKAADGAPLSTIVQLTQGESIVAWSCPRFAAKATREEQDGEFAVSLTGRCLGTAADDEVFLAFLG